MEDQDEIQPLTYQELFDFIRKSVDMGQGQPITLFNLDDGGYYRIFKRDVMPEVLATEEEEGYVLFLQRIDSPITS